MPQTTQPIAGSFSFRISFQAHSFIGHPEYLVQPELVKLSENATETAHLPHVSRSLTNKRRGS
jgi:hypothetical protein